MDPKNTANLDPKLQETYNRVMGTPGNPSTPVTPPTPVSQPAPTPMPVIAHPQPTPSPVTPPAIATTPMPSPSPIHPPTPTTPFAAHTTPTMTAPVAPKPIAANLPIAGATIPLGTHPVAPAIPPQQQPVAKPAPAAQMHEIPTINPFTHSAPATPVIPAPQPTPVPSPVASEPHTAVSHEATPAQSQSGDNMQATVAAPTLGKVGNTSLHGFIAPKQKSKISPVIIIVGVVAFVIVYTLFWLKFFKISVPFLGL